MVSPAFLNRGAAGHRARGTDSREWTDIPQAPLAPSCRVLAARRGFRRQRLTGPIIPHSGRSNATACRISSSMMQPLAGFFLDACADAVPALFASDGDTDSSACPPCSNIRVLRPDKFLCLKRSDCRRLPLNFLSYYSHVDIANHIYPEIVSLSFWRCMSDAAILILSSFHNQLVCLILLQRIEREEWRLYQKPAKPSEVQRRADHDRPGSRGNYSSRGLRKR